MTSTTKIAQARVDHLDRLLSIESAADPAYEEWARTRMDRMLSDLMLRRGYTVTAQALSQKRSIQSLVDDAVFEEIAQIERTLPPAESASAPNAAGGTSAKVTAPTCAAALAWCAENRSALKKIKSTLEFELRLQEFIELARMSTAESLQEAIAHARKHLLPFCVDPTPVATNASGSAAATGAEAAQQQEASQAAMLQSRVYRAMGLLACRATGWSYEDLYHQGRWAMLRDMFRACALEIHSLPSQPVMHIALSAGLSTLKLPVCYTKDGVIEQAREEARAKAAAAAAAASATSNEKKKPTSLETPQERIHLPTFPPAAGHTHDHDSAASPSAASAGEGGAMRIVRQAHLRHHLHLVREDTATTGTGDPQQQYPAYSAPQAGTIGYGMQANSSDGVLLDGRNLNCPVCDTDGLGQLAKEVPWSHHAISTLICRLSGKVMNESDYPAALPNGRVYSYSVSSESLIFPSWVSADSSLRFLSYFGFSANFHTVQGPRRASQQIKRRRYDCRSSDGRDVCIRLSEKAVHFVIETPFPF